MLSGVSLFLSYACCSIVIMMMFRSTITAMRHKYIKKEVRDPKSIRINTSQNNRKINSEDDGKKSLYKDRYIRYKGKTDILYVL